MPRDDAKDGVLPYLKLFPEEYQGGSLHYGCSLEERAFFIELLCIAAKNRKERGTLSLEVGKPMPIAVIANAAFIDVQTCARLLSTMEKQGRIACREDKVIVILNFDFYQKHYRVKKNNKPPPKFSEMVLDRLNVERQVQKPALNLEGTTLLHKARLDLETGGIEQDETVLAKQAAVMVQSSQVSSIREKAKGNGHSAEGVAL